MTLSSRRALALWFGLLVTALALGCERSKAVAGAPHEDKLVIFAAASLREVFTALGSDFERAHAGVTLTFNFAGSQELRTQIEHGAPADVFASADQRQVNELLKAARVTSPVVFARNEPVVVVTKASPIGDFGDLPRAERIVIGAPEVPIGRYTLQMLDRAAATFGPDFRARVEARVVSRELNVKQVLTKVSLGEAEAGVVYRTDASAAGDQVRALRIPHHVNVIAEYPIAVVSGALHPNLARAWIELVRSATGKQALSKAGFLGPAEGPRKP
jgi:molybdate transport system substrate-binding protein